MGRVDLPEVTDLPDTTREVDVVCKDEASFSGGHHFSLLSAEETGMAGAAGQSPVPLNGPVRVRSVFDHWNRPVRSKALHLFDVRRISPHRHRDNQPSAGGTRELEAPQVQAERRRSDVHEHRARLEAMIGSTVITGAVGGRITSSPGPMPYA